MPPIEARPSVWVCCRCRGSNSGKLTACWLCVGSTADVCAGLPPWCNPQPIRIHAGSGRIICIDHTRLSGEIVLCDLPARVFSCVDPSQVVHRDVIVRATSFSLDSGLFEEIPSTVQKAYCERHARVELNHLIRHSLLYATSAIK